MLTTDPIADLLTRMRNAIRARKSHCEIPASKEKEHVLRVLRQSGYIQSFVRQEETPQDKLIVTFKYVGKNQKSVIHKIGRVSKPGRRVYSGYRDIRPFLSGVGMRIFSTPKGIMTDSDARKQKVGGEVLCEVW